jgi:hypothetical protein
MALIDPFDGTFRWGCHRGKTIAEVPTGYLQWLSSLRKRRGVFDFYDIESVATELASRGQAPPPGEIVVHRLSDPKPKKAA